MSETMISGFSADMPAGPGKHHFEAVYTPEGIHVTGTVIMEGSAVGTYEADMKKTDSDLLPADPEGPSGPPDGPGGPRAAQCAAPTTNNGADAFFS